MEAVLIVTNSVIPEILRSVSQYNFKKPVERSPEFCGQRYECIVLP